MISRKSSTAGIKRGKREEKKKYKKTKGQAAKISPKRITMRVVIKSLRLRQRQRRQRRPVVGRTEKLIPFDLYPVGASAFAILPL